MMNRRYFLAHSAALGGALALAAACAPSTPAASTRTPGTAPAPAALTISGIPDQSASTLDQLFGLAAKYLSRATNLKVRYAPSTDYAAIVTAFRRGDVHVAWFGGLTHVQARAQVPGARAIVQRPRDARFRSVFVAAPEVRAQGLTDLKGSTFTFGSESSTSGHLMPRYYMLQEGLDADRDLKGAPGFSGSHDKTYKLVESGAVQAGALSEVVWESAVAGTKVDPSRVRVVYRTPTYFDYNWTIHPALNSTYGAGTEERVTSAFLDLNAGIGEDEKLLLDLFATDRFVPTQNENYQAIEEIATRIGLLQ